MDTIMAWSAPQYLWWSDYISLYNTKSLSYASPMQKKNNQKVEKNMDKKTEMSSYFTAF